MGYNIDNIIVNLKKQIQESGGGSGTSDYSQLTNKPQINEVTLSGNKSLSDLGIARASDLAAVEALIPESASTSNQLATASDIPDAVSGNPSGSATAGNLTTLQIGSDIYSVPSGGINTTRYFRKQCDKSDLELRQDNKGYSFLLGNDLTQAELTVINNANLVLSNCYGFVPGLGLRLVNSVIGKPNNIFWFFSQVNQIAPERWVQMMRTSDADKMQCYGIISTEIYNELSDVDVAAAWDLYLLA